MHSSQDVLEASTDSHRNAVAAHQGQVRQSHTLRVADPRVCGRAIKESPAPFRVHPTDRPNVLERSAAGRPQERVEARREEPIHHPAASRAVKPGNDTHRMSEVGGVSRATVAGGD